MQGKSLYAILLSIIAVLTLALAVLVIFLFTTYNGINPDKQANATEPPQQVRDVPPEEQAKLNIYATEDGIGGDAIFNLKPSPAHENSFLKASVTIVYDTGKKRKNLEERTAILKECLGEFKEACIEYFRSQTYEQLSEDNAMEKARDTLRDKFNSILEGRTDERIVLRVVFEGWIIQP
ncbi:flagellar basal body-associated FliL family protein [Thermoclostridium caenicola]|uniref:flagellar basal body-associated FliL family protein n=1 Tax=Thermoclostridium caenicola TaxID=659425 RepID=UPI00122C829A|nr:flagellar basal body-associated FliL family protein [Thermoclostridium caenicola]HPO75843.1 flagellar basal body-associated FliL family protein [Thermoclostridium caenicola]